MKKFYYVVLIFLLLFVLVQVKEKLEGTIFL
ncbi:hypothetical protein X927_01650 [Petrotoga mexicana DSM 14811]|uniref:Uncharacterized protein n=2 Tax=Petrotoga TaxID=28236 RepID=A0A2K1PDV9_9BACT|nr:hypothetical protein X928_05520 [Petrotoga miotherma DSM 10691]PNS00969.1 hypothetical protein X927_01650 [Petrotoga mexicana DSM 14811]